MPLFPLPFLLKFPPQKIQSHLPGMCMMLVGRAVHPEVHPEVIPACPPCSSLQDFGHDGGDQAHPGDRWHRLGGQSHREGGGRWRGAAGRGVDLRVLPRRRLDVSWVFSLQTPKFALLTPRNFPISGSGFSSESPQSALVEPKISYLRIVFFLGNASICSVDPTKSQIFTFQCLIFPWKQPKLLCWP